MKDKWNLGTQKVSQYCGKRWMGRGGRRRRKEEREQRGEAQPVSDMEEVRLYSHALPETGQDSPSSLSLAAETDSQGIAGPSLPCPCHLCSLRNGWGGPNEAGHSSRGQILPQAEVAGALASLWTNSGNGDSNGTKNM